MFDPQFARRTARFSPTACVPYRSCLNAGCHKFQCHAITCAADVHISDEVPFSLMVSIGHTVAHNSAVTLCKATPSEPQLPRRGEFRPTRRPPCRESLQSCAQRCARIETMRENGTSSEMWTSAAQVWRGHWNL